MARVLVLEPDDDLRQLFAHMLRHLGHEVVRPEHAPDTEVLLVEPSADDELALACSLRRHRPDLPVVCASIHSPGEETRCLAPCAHLVKPFGLVDLETALESVLQASLSV